MTSTQEQSPRQSRRETTGLIEAQILRAANIVKKSRFFDFNNGESVTYNTPWANLAYDSDSDVVQQARLHGVFRTKLKIMSGRLACVQLYTREAGLYDPTEPKYGDDYEYSALFSGHDQQITVPKEGVHFPLAGEEVLPDTPVWRALDYTLGQIEAQALLHPSKG